MEDFEELLKSIEAQQKVANNENKILQTMLVLRDDTCPHTNVETKEKYHEGGYLDTDYTEYWNQCICCDAKSIVTTKNHGNFS